MKNYQNALEEACVQLQHLESPRFEAESLLAFVLQCNRSRIVAFPEKLLSEDEYTEFCTYVNDRRSGIPFAYITGQKEFYDLILKVTPATLIPRSDTELLIETALSKIADDQNCSVIDLGTGSGAIALTIKKHRPNARVTAVDQSQEALTVAMENGKNLQLDVTFKASNWFSGVNGETFDFILSNPPYIEAHDKHLVGDGVKFEPITALVADHDGFADLFHLIDHAQAYLCTNGWLMMEHGFEQGVWLRERMRTLGYQNIETLQDLSGNDRITIGQK